MAAPVRVKSHELGAEHYEECPVWAWADDYEDESLVFPVPEHDPLPDDLGDLFVKAEFATPAGRRFDGYVVAGIETFAAGLWVGGATFDFNVRLRSLAERSLADLRRAVGDAEDPVFPLRYETGLRFADGTPLSGTFDPFA